MEGWKEKLLNQSGKEVLIKSVLQAIPSYAMAIIRFPKNFCHSISSHIARFWWRRPGRERGIHWKAWNSITRAKGRGGLGFKDFSIMNTSLLANQAWRALRNPDSLWVQVLKGLYFPQEDFLHASRTRGSSRGWRSLLQGKNFLLKHGRWMIGNGKKVRIWEDNWLATQLPPNPEAATRGTTVNSLLSEDHLQWNQTKLLQLFQWQVAFQICQLPISILNQEDKFY